MPDAAADRTPRACNRLTPSWLSAGLLAAAAVTAGGCVSATEWAPPLVIKVDGTAASCRMRIGDRTVSRYDVVAIGYAEAKRRNRATIQADARTAPACIESAVYMAGLAGFSEREGPGAERGSVPFSSSIRRFQYYHEPPTT